ncbi:WYL domain-containing protein [Clavibacter lycopersici]|uniref:WYL domain-containing protein n=1 Tax=Clavibacter lycopersici TaxID=2301718 RepID=A0A399T5P2_9MICO|nr:WYL domain-containing protein [Clavibacter lycopersici]RIJ51680.1 WYL domain-containing protein [Clavibacter lycopersici]RIJ58990.1 WYL domain-containing protein [Clavibacter lycopersici]
MPSGSSALTSRRLLALLSLLQSPREWPGPVLAARLGTTPRTIRRDVERLRELGYAIDTTRGPLGGYRLGSGSALPPLLLDDEQALAVAVALRTTALTGTAVEEAAARALRTVTRLMPDRLATRVGRLEIEAAEDPSRGDRAPVDPKALLRIGDAIQRREEIRFDLLPATGATETPTGPRPPRRIEPHHLVLRAGRWYVIGWSTERDDWRVHRVDRVELKSHGGRRFERREVPGGDAAGFLTARFRGSPSTDGGWPCAGTVLLDLPAAAVAPYAGDGTVEDIGPGRCRYDSGSWSWHALAADLGRFGADMQVVGPDELRAACADLAGRYARAAADPAT